MTTLFISKRGKSQAEIVVLLELELEFCVISFAL